MDITPDGRELWVTQRFLRRVAIVDTRPWGVFRERHAEGALFAPLDNMFPNVAGSYIGEDEEIHLIVEPHQLDLAVRALVRIGLDHVRGWISPEEFARVPGGVGAAEIPAQAAQERLAAGTHFPLDVRRADEFAEGHVPGAKHVAYPRLPEHLDELPKDRPILVNCRGGARSARAVSYLLRHGFDAANVAGGFLAWEKAGLPVQR